MPITFNRRNKKKNGRRMSIKRYGVTRKMKRGRISKYRIKQRGGTHFPFYDYKEILDTGGDRSITASELPAAALASMNSLTLNSGDPNKSWFGWAKSLIDKLKQNVIPQRDKPEDVDDHNATTIGNGYTIGLVHGVLNINGDDLKRIPYDLKTGMFKQTGNFRTTIRFSEAPVGEGAYHLARLAAKIELGADKEIDILTTETGQNFPIPNNNALSFFHSLEAKKLGTIARGFAYLKNVVDMVKNSKPTDQQLRELHLPYTVAGRDYYSMSPFAIEGKKSSAVVKFAFTPKAETRDIFTTGLAEQAKTANPATLSRLVKENTKFTMKEGFERDVKNNDIVFDFKIQFSTDPVRDPINYLTKNWESPYYKVGTLTIPKQELTKDGMATIFAPHLENTKRLSFVPGKIHKGVGDVSAYRNYLYPLYNKARQQHVLGIVDGTPIRCPFGFSSCHMSNPENPHHSVGESRASPRASPRASQQQTTKLNSKVDMSMIGKIRSRITNRYM